MDYVIDIIYDNSGKDTFLYGGTAIWRCFGGMRFSEGMVNKVKDETGWNKIDYLELHG